MGSSRIITALHLPAESGNLRIDHALRADMAVPPYYDPLLAKVISWYEDRLTAIEQLVNALQAIRIEGVKTSIPTNLKILRNELFRKGDFDTSFLENAGA